MMQQEAQDDYVVIEQEWVFQKCYALVCILLENSRLEMVEALMKTLTEVIDIFPFNGFFPLVADRILAHNLPPNQRDRQP